MNLKTLSLFAGIMTLLLGFATIAWGANATSEEHQLPPRQQKIPLISAFAASGDNALAVLQEVVNSRK